MKYEYGNRKTSCLPWNPESGDGGSFGCQMWGEAWIYLRVGPSEEAETWACSILVQVPVMPGWLLQKPPACSSPILSLVVHTGYATHHEVGSDSPFIESGLLISYYLPWLTECSRNDSVQALGLTFKKPVSFHFYSWELAAMWWGWPPGDWFCFHLTSHWGI